MRENLISNNRSEKEQSRKEMKNIKEQKKNKLELLSIYLNTFVLNVTIKSMQSIQIYTNNIFAVNMHRAK